MLVVIKLVFYAARMTAWLLDKAIMKHEVADDDDDAGVVCSGRMRWHTLVMLDRRGRGRNHTGKARTAARTARIIPNHYGRLRRNVFEG